MSDQYCLPLSNANSLIALIASEEAGSLLFSIAFNFIVIVVRLCPAALTLEPGLPTAHR